MPETSNNQTFAARMEAVVQTLKPCPFCAGKTLKAANVIVDDSSVNDFSEVFCADCGTRGPKAECWESAAEAWNRRSCNGCDGRGCPKCNPTPETNAIDASCVFSTAIRAAAEYVSEVLVGGPMNEDVESAERILWRFLEQPWVESPDGPGYWWNRCYAMGKYRHDHLIEVWQVGGKLLCMHEERLKLAKDVAGLFQRVLGPLRREPN